jgi:preprotein translocase subunit SecA
LEREYRTAHVRPVEPLLRGLDSWADVFRGRRRRHAKVTVDLWMHEAVSAGEERTALEKQGGDALADLLDAARSDWRRSRATRRNVIRPKILGLIAEMARRTTGLTAHPVQLAAAVGLDSGALVELATGEGKSLSAALAAVLAAWTGRPCHVVTVNDYLASRDAAWFRDFYLACRVSVAAVQATDDAARRREAHEAGVTYITGKELLADFLRDRLALGMVADPERRLIRAFRGGADVRRCGCVLRGLGSAIVDEADSVLIDEAVTPLIISKKRDDPDLAEACRAASRIAYDFHQDLHFTADIRRREILIRKEGEAAIAARALEFPVVWRGSERRRELVERALEARMFFQRGRNYEVQDNQVVIVNEFTGRLMPGRTWREGLHQAIEAREGLPVTPPTETAARLSFQRFFRLFPRLSGTSGTAAEAADELWRIYGLPVVPLPTHRPRRLTVHPAVVFRTEAEKWNAVLDEIQRLRVAGRPVLVGLRSVAASEALSARLTAEGIEHQVLNALRHREEAMVVALAGGEGRVTLATNMAGRGTDIRLGEGVAARGGLCVIATELHESGRIDRQLMGRAGRQGDPGEALQLLSIEDELVRRYLAPWLVRGLAACGARRLIMRLAQWLSERQAARMRRRVLQQDEHLEESLALAGRRLG